MNDLNTALAERNRLRRELDKAEREYKVQAELAAALVTVRAAGYSVVRAAPAVTDYTRQAIAAGTSIGVHSGQARSGPVLIPRAAFTVETKQTQANADAWHKAKKRGSKAYEWFPNTSAHFDGCHSPDFVVRAAPLSTNAIAGPFTLVHIPTGHETTGFPDFASLGRYIRARKKSLRNHNIPSRDWRSTYHADVNA